MSTQRRCIRITGTRTGKLRARVETTKQTHIGFGHYQIETDRFEVTIGGEKWATLSSEDQIAIFTRARSYVEHLQGEIGKELHRSADELEEAS